eukprot:GEMP01005181.1.p1 GENE.GEMP01005181.1~~GEMP01005181.1.p1  ORF type:complete len:706 (-),score=136.20 GEMP01005181.1:1884-4001(-)
MDVPTWEYVDRHSKLQGKFTTHQMRQWYIHGMLPENLRIRSDSLSLLLPLNVAFGPNKVPFESVPEPPLKTGTNVVAAVAPNNDLKKPLPRPKKEERKNEHPNGGKGKGLNKEEKIESKNAAAAPQLNTCNKETHYGSSTSSSSSSRNIGDTKNASAKGVAKKINSAQPAPKKEAKGGKGKSTKGGKDGKGDGTKKDDKGGWNEWCGWAEWFGGDKRKENEEPEPPNEDVDPRKWEYVDAQGKIQGPFDHRAMVRWKEANMLPTWLKVRPAGTQKWGELMDFFGLAVKKRVIPEKIETLEYIFEQRDGLAEPPTCWSIERTIKEQDGSTWEEKWMSPLRIRFSQKEIHPFFHHRGSIEEVLPEIQRRTLAQEPGDDRPPICELDPPFPPIRVVELNNQARQVQNDLVITLDNRRLYALQRVALETWPKLTLVKVWASPWTRLSQKKLKSEWRKFSHGKDGGVAATISSRTKEWELWDWRQELALLERARFPRLGMLPLVDHPRAPLTGSLSFSLLPLFFFSYLNRPLVQKKIIKHFPVVFHIAKVFGRPLVSQFRLSKILQRHIHDLLYRRAFKSPKVSIPYTAKATVKVSREGTNVEVRATLGKGLPNADVKTDINGRPRTPLSSPAPSPLVSPRRGEVCAVEPAIGVFLTPSQLAFTVQMLPWASLPIALGCKTTKARRRLAVCLLFAYGYLMMWRGHKWMAD